MNVSTPHLPEAKTDLLKQSVRTLNFMTHKKKERKKEKKQKSCIMLIMGWWQNLSFGFYGCACTDMIVSAF